MYSPKSQGYIYATIQFILGAVIIFLSFVEHASIFRTPIPFLRYMSYALIVISVCFMLPAFLTFGQAITPNPVPKDNYVLRTGGIYSIIRHPMYAGILIGLIGLPLAFSAYYTLPLDIFTIIFFIKKINFEEQQLVKKFPEYIAYQKQTKKIIPFVY